MMHPDGAASCKCDDLTLELTSSCDAESESGLPDVRTVLNATQR